MRARGAGGDLEVKHFFCNFTMLKRKENDTGKDAR